MFRSAAECGTTEIIGHGAFRASGNFGTSRTIATSVPKNLPHVFLFPCTPEYVSFLE